VADELNIRINISPEQTEALLSRLAEDDDFRESVEKDPSGMLAEYGIRIPADLLAGPQIELPSKEEMAVFREQLQSGELDPGTVFPGPIRMFGPFILMIMRFFRPFMPPLRSSRQP
jgi:putative modified peptide